jgi:hypothetical protein
VEEKKKEDKTEEKEKKNSVDVAAGVAGMPAVIF